MKISFLIPAYNSAQWIKSLLDSIPKEYAYEIIVCDDNSSDRTIEILEAYRKSCPQLKILKNKRNYGANHSYNRCIDEASGDYLAIIDSDDYYLPTIRDVLKQVDGQYDIYYYNMRTKAGRLIVKKESDGYTWPGQFKIVRRSFVGSTRYANKKFISGDGHFHRELINKNPKCKYTGITAYFYNHPRLNSESDINKKYWAALKKQGKKK